MKVTEYISIDNLFEEIDDIIDQEGSLGNYSINFKFNDEDFNSCLSDIGKLGNIYFKMCSDKDFTVIYRGVTIKVEYDGYPFKIADLKEVTKELFSAVEDKESTFVLKSYCEGIAGLKVYSGKSVDLCNNKECNSCRNLKRHLDNAFKYLNELNIGDSKDE